VTIVAESIDTSFPGGNTYLQSDNVLATATHKE
jgi:hypothetical protein